MVDIYRTRRGYNYKCYYWKRNLKGVMDNETLIHNVQPSGIFYAKLVNPKNKTTENVANVFHIDVHNTSLETLDIVDIEDNDLVQFKNNLWMVTNVNITPIQKNNEFSNTESNKTIISINKGN